jgi:hypothetical protein
MIILNAMYEHHYGGTVFVEKSENDKVIFQNNTIPDMDVGEVAVWDADKFNEQFTYVSG